MADPPDAIRVTMTNNRARQCELYGAPLGDRVRRLTGLLGISQARLARVLGLSPAMLSQLVSARRVKIGDPTVLARLLLLDQRCRGRHEGPPPAVVDALLADVARANWQWARWERSGADHGRSGSRTHRPDQRAPAPRPAVGPPTPGPAASRLPGPVSGRLPGAASGRSGPPSGPACGPASGSVLETGAPPTKRRSRVRIGAGSAADALRGIAEPARLAAAAAALGPAFPELAELLRQAAGRPPAVRTD
jgi:hypothetical protein